MAYGYPATLDVDYPRRDLDRLSSGLRIFWAVPILILLATVSGASFQYGTGTSRSAAATAGGVLFLGPLLMVLFRQKYPRWWFDWNRELVRFGMRVSVYMALMDDRYPSTDEQQSVHLELDYPDAKNGINRWLPLVKWFLAIPHYVVLLFLSIGAFFAVIGAWFAILFTGRYPESIFGFVEGVFRWHLRVYAYAILLVTDRYPPFSLDR